MLKFQIGNGLATRWEDEALVIMADDVGIQTRLDTRNLFMASVLVMRTLDALEATVPAGALTVGQIVDGSGNPNLLLSQAAEALRHLHQGQLVETAHYEQGHVWWLSPKAEKAGAAT